MSKTSKHLVVLFLLVNITTMSSAARYRLSENKLETPITGDGKLSGDLVVDVRRHSHPRVRGSPKVSNVPVVGVHNVHHSPVIVIPKVSDIPVVGDQKVLVKDVGRMLDLVICGLFECVEKLTEDPV